MNTVRNFFQKITGPSVSNSKVNTSKGVLSTMKNPVHKNIGSVNYGFTQSSNQRGGVAPVNFRYPANMQQPSEDVMQWATTAGLPTPMTGMRNVAHGGRRKTKGHHKQHKKSMTRKNKGNKRTKRNSKNKKANRK